ncbi:hypothetical protein O988_04875 [Pseudogymnoascus sp. VKM F-3808]|nr:hypothetical protein O988_04875 [Pseudogymnoascus sp. VKM F-3808]
MIDCLCFLQQEGIKHGDIRKGTIIVTQRPFKVCLAGFSISTKIVSPLEVDIADLCRTYRSVALDTPDDSGDSEEGSMRGDPEIAALVRQVLSSAPDRMSAHRIKLHISSLVGDTPGGPFAMVNVARSWQLKIRREGKGVFVEVAALLDRLLAQRRCHHINTPPSESKAFEFFPKFRRRVFDKVEFCTSQQALNFCDAFNLEEFARIIQIEVYKNRAVQSSPVRILEGEQELFQIGYHVSTLMFNLTHIAEVLGWRLAFCKDLSIPPTFQEVYDERWGGTYVDQRFCDSFLRDKHDSIGRSIQQVKAVPNPVLSAQFTSNSPEYILIFTGRLRPSMVAVRRTDSFVNWAPSSENDAKFVSTEESCSKCDAENLPLLKRKLLALREQSRLWFWSSWGPYLETIQNDGSDTEVATDESDDDRSQFKFKLK